MTKTINRYIPELVYQRIKTLNNFKEIDYLIFICDMMYRIKLFKKFEDNYSPENYLDIPKSYITSTIKKRETANQALQYLLTHNIIQSDNVCISKSKAFGYRFNEDLISPITQIKIEKENLIKNIIMNKNARNNAVSQDLKHAKNYFIKHFKIDFERASQFIEGIYHQDLNKATTTKERLQAINKYNSYLLSIYAIKDGELFFKKNKTNGRIDTNLTSLKSELKQFIIGAESLTSIDISNSQPLLLSSFISSLFCTLPSATIDTKELERYSASCIRGTFYDDFMIEYNLTIIDSKRKLTRMDIKEMMFCIFYSKNESYIKEKRIFESIYPSISRFIHKYKSENDYNKLAIELQRLESDIIINSITKDLDKNSINYWTIHDSFIVATENTLKTKEVIENEFWKRFGYVPNIKVENLG